MVGGSLEGKRVLVVEDEFLIAHDLRRALVALDAEVVGPVSNLPAGLALLETERIDAVVIDVNLCGTMSFPLADLLHDAGVPMVFVTGYDDWVLPAKFAEHPLIRKPFACADVTNVIQRMCLSGQD